MFIIHYTLMTGDVRKSQAFFDYEDADRWRRLLLQDPQVTEAEVVQAACWKSTEVHTNASAISARM